MSSPASAAVPDSAHDASFSHYQVVIQPNQTWLRIDWHSIWEYRDLLKLLVRREFLWKYKQTVLGPLWFVVQPLLTTIVFTVIFGHVAHISTDGLPPLLFYLCGLLGWKYLEQNITNGGAIFTNNAYLFGKVYFPRLIMPLSLVTSNLFALALQFVTFLAFYFYFKFCTPAGATFGMNIHVLWLPLLIAQTALLSLGVTLWMSSMTAKYRDLIHLLAFITQLWMFATPVIYPLSNVPPRWKWIADLNPMTAIVEGFRACLLGISALNPATLSISIGMTLLIVLSGILAFQRTERTFIDTV